VEGSSVSTAMNGSAYSHDAAVSGIEIASESHSDCLTATSARRCSSAPFRRETTLMVPEVSASDSPKPTK